MRIKLLGAAIIAALLTVLIGTTAATANHSWGGYHWARTSNPFTLKLGDNVSSSWDSYLRTTSTDWSESSVLDTTVVAGTTTGSQCRATVGRVEVCNSTYGNNGWLGLASISITGGTHITQGTVKLNDTYFNTAQYNTVAYRNLVMCQEVGHTFGLDHQDENQTNPNLGTCMDYTSSPGTNQFPNQHDYDQLESIYAHLDSTTTVGSSIAKNKKQVTDDPSSWGKRVKGSADKGAATYVRDLGGGNKVVTQVIWAD